MNAKINLTKITATFETPYLRFEWYGKGYTEVFCQKTDAKIATYLLTNYQAPTLSTVMREVERYSTDYENDNGYTVITKRYALAKDGDGYYVARRKDKEPDFPCGFVAASTVEEAVQHFDAWGEHLGYWSCA